MPASPPPASGLRRSPPRRCSRAFPSARTPRAIVDWFFAGNGRKLYQEMYDQAELNVHVIPCAFGGAEASRLVRQGDSQSSRTSRACACAASALAAGSCRGSAPPRCSSPAAKLGDAFDKHEIDGAEFLTPAVDQRQRLQDHVKLIYVPGWHQPETVLELLVNQERWNALNEEQRTVLETACRSMLLTTLAESPRLQAAALAELAKQGVRIETWSDDLARGVPRTPGTRWRRRKATATRSSGRCSTTRQIPRRSRGKWSGAAADAARALRAASTRGRPGRECVANVKSSRSGICLQIGDDVGPLTGVGDAWEGEGHHRIRDHRLRIGDPLVDILLGPDISRPRRASSCRPSRSDSRRRSRPCARQCRSAQGRRRSWRRRRSDGRWRIWRRLPCPCRRHRRQKPSPPKTIVTAADATATRNTFLILNLPMN